MGTILPLQAIVLLCLCRAFALPLTTQLSEEDEKVTKCITEILADTLSGPSPHPVTSKCMKILREDERVLAMLHHQHLLSELEELAHQENLKHRLGHDAWEGENGGQEEVKKRDTKPIFQRETTTEKMSEQSGERKEEELKEYEKTEKMKEKVKEEKVSEGEAHRQALEEQVKELMEEEEEGKKEEEEEEARKKRRSSSETWSSKEYFGHVKSRGSGQPKIREGMLQGDQDERKRNGLVKRRFNLEEEEDESDEEEPRKYHHRGFNEGRHHDWDEEEVKKRPYLAKRVAEKASDEETSQFEEEEKGVKISNSQSHLHGGLKPWQEEQEEEVGGSKHRHHHKISGLDLKKRHEKDAMYLKGRYHSHDAEEEEEREASSDEKLKKLEEIEEELKMAAERLEKLKRG
ncbi:coiled-coil domain-containing glutamate-rich protein 2 [Anolis carolinensis]|uniref:coiled-coil domain-containing glutamate-rich protein 2 n=1 Tax=Anolis carolinensis TaxID=28377 RepID=UPI0007DB6BF5|nr:PREDICTED: coiled-coil domain-containing glutamate-rich protein 2 [Anolis carolinensis]|eukprot:XP_008121586.2 PREDICTED: coiled-coil domain-containing glutamate-rich protein 2 [Anolis carolinensis]